MTEDGPSLLPFVEEEIPKILQESFENAISALHALERRTRIAKDSPANCMVCNAIVKRCIDESRWNDLAVNVTELSNRRQYVRKSITEIVRLSMDSLDQILNEETRINLIRCLRDVTEGKIFIEVERAKLTSYLVDYLEARGELEEAMNLLQDLRLEILTSMDEKERIGMMLHQFKLCLDTKDSLRASLCAEKIADQRVNDNDQKLEFLDLSIRYHNEFTHDHMKIAQDFYKIYEINSSGEALTYAIINAVLAPHTDVQQQFFASVKNLKDLTLMYDARTLLAVFAGRELVTYPEFEQRFGQLIESETKDIMRRRVIEHGLRTVSLYYTRIRLERLAELLVLSVDELEERIIDLVFAEGFYARIDRPAGIVTFKKQKKVSELADEFSANIAQVCRLVDHAHSLIEKERQVVHRVKA